MVGADAERFCESCKTRVFDLSNMTEHEARSLLSGHGGKTMCIRYRVDARGDIVHAPSRPAPLAAGAVLSAALAGGCASHGGDGLLDAPDDQVCTDIDGTVLACETDEEWEPRAETPDPDPGPSPDIVAELDDPVSEEPDDDGYWFEEEPVVEEELDPDAPDEGCTAIEIEGEPLMGAVVVIDDDYRARRDRRTRAYLRAHTDRVKAWFAERRERRQARKAQRRLARIDR